VKCYKYKKILREKDAMEKAVKCHKKSIEKKDSTEKLVKKQENIPIKIVHQITRKRK
jgi:hypothetical protein